jgi:hypothetical protein
VKKQRALKKPGPTCLAFFLIWDIRLFAVYCSPEQALKAEVVPVLYSANFQPTLFQDFALLVPTI